MAIAAMAIKSELQPFKLRYVPSARPTRWTDGPILPTAAKASIGYPLNTSSNPTNDKTCQPNINSPHISLVEYLMDLWKASTSEKVQAVCDMSTIAFYYLLHVGEYTDHRRKDRRQTKQFWACDITFYNCQHTIIPNTAPLAQLYTATKAAMRITNQKNGTRGSIISHNISLTKA
jgi:hypothetical protein